MKKLFILFGLAVAIAGSSVATQAQAPLAAAPVAEVAAPVKADPNDQQRISDLEAYVNNTARGLTRLTLRLFLKYPVLGLGITASKWFARHWCSL